MLISDHITQKKITKYINAVQFNRNQYLGNKGNNCEELYTRETGTEIKYIQS